MGELIVFVSQARDLYAAAARMASYDPEGIFDLRVVDNETEEVIPNIMLAIAALHRGIQLPKKEPNIKVNWSKEGF